MKGETEMVTTREAIKTMEEDYSASSASSNGHIEISSDAYEDLRNATPEELLEAVLWFLRQSLNTPNQIELATRFLRHGFALAQPGGGEHVAPWWLRESRRLAALDTKGE